MSKIALISTVKAPAHELIEFVNYHLKIGINEILLFFDDPNDKAIALFNNKPQVHSILCTPDYWGEREQKKPESIETRQIINVNHGVDIAKSKNCQWMIHIDSDELVFNTLQQSIDQLLANSNADIVRLAVREAIADQPYPDSIFQTKWFKKPSKEKTAIKAIKLGCKQAFFEGEFFRGHLESKAFVKISAKVLKYGIHYPIEYDSKLVVKWVEELKLLHFDCIGFDAWQSKWNRRLDGTATANKMRKNRKIQFQEYQQAKNLGEQQLLILYKKMHTIPMREKSILFLLGMIEKIHIDFGDK